jgi:hypothetical protein
VEGSQICEGSHLKEMVLEAGEKIHGKNPLDDADDQSQIVCMAKILAPAGYHQKQDIDEALGLDFDENLANEWDWESYQQEVHHRKAQLLGNLKNLFPLPAGLSFSFGHDREGNFGIIVQRETENKKGNNLAV